MSTSTKTYMFTQRSGPCPFTRRLGGDESPPFTMQVEEVPNSKDDNPLEADCEHVIEQKAKYASQKKYAQSEKGREWRRQYDKMYVRRTTRSSQHAYYQTYYEKNREDLIAVQTLRNKLLRSQEKLKKAIDNLVLNSGTDDSYATIKNLQQCVEKVVSDFDAMREKKKSNEEKRLAQRVTVTPPFTIESDLPSTLP